MIRFLIVAVVVLFGHLGSAQKLTDDIITLEEYLAYVKKYHPVVKQALLISSEGEAKLLKARGAFDPKIEIDFSKKQFKDTEYYNKLNSAFKIPTWYGVEFKASYETAEGAYINPESKLPAEGLYSAGVSLSLAKGLLTNERMAALKQAKLYQEISRAKQQMMVNTILYEAIHTYFIWLKNYQTYQIHGAYLKNGKQRLHNVSKSYLSGDKPAVDTLEASINLKNRLLEMEKARIDFLKSTLEVSNYLWLENDLPLELNANMKPDPYTDSRIDNVLKSSVLQVSDSLINTHPKIKALQLEKEILAVDKRLKMNALLPTVDLQYHFLTTDRNDWNSLNTFNYKNGLYINFPLFLRKERGDLKLAKIKLQDINFELSAAKINLQNKITAVREQIASYKSQYDIVKELVNDYQHLVRAEERRFNLGEGSLFLINYREAKLIETELKRIETGFNLLNAKATLVQQMNFFEAE